MSNSGGSGRGRESRRFRKPDFRAPRSDEAASPEEETNLPAVNQARMAEELGMALAPLKDLAEAFRQNSEAMKSLAEGQARLGRRVEKSDRSQAIVQSTKALNETFRGVQRTQERLMGRLDGERKRPLLLLLASAAVFVALVGGSLYILFHWLDDRDRVESLDRKETIQGIVAAHADVVEDLRTKLARAETELARRESDAKNAQANLEDLSRRLAEAEEINQGLRQNQEGLRREVMQNAELQTTISRLTAELEEKAEALLAERRTRVGLEEQLQTLQDKLGRMARQAAASPAAVSPPAKPAPEVKAPDVKAPEVRAPGDPDEEPPPSSVPPGAATNPGELARISQVLNRLISESRGGESYEFTKIGGARGKTLYDVEVANYDQEGAEIKRIQAGELRIVVDVPQRSVELHFKKGHIYYYGVRAPFWGGVFNVSVVNVDPAAWLNSGLTIFDELR